MIKSKAVRFCLLLVSSVVIAESDPSWSKLEFDDNPAVASSKTVKLTGAIRSCRETSYAGPVLFKFDSSEGFNAVCVQRHHSFGDGWVVMQQRVDGMGDFYNNWAKYRDGFGSFENTFWMGLENIYQITSRAPQELIVEVVVDYGEYSYARYSNFAIGNELEKYALLSLGNYSGNAGDYLSTYQGFGFSTFDDDNDTNQNKNCAIKMKGAWWYSTKCEEEGCNLNTSYNVKWNRHNYNTLRYSRMLLREKEN